MSSEFPRNSECWCCLAPVESRNPDPWEGRLDGYCYNCALTRCDAFPWDCHEIMGDGASGDAPNPLEQPASWSNPTSGQRFQTSPTCRA